MASFWKQKMIKWSVVEVAEGDIISFGDKDRLVEFTLEDMLLFLDNKPRDVHNAPGVKAKHELALVTMNDEGEDREFAWVVFDKNGPRLPTKFSDGTPVPWKYVEELERVAELLLAMWKERRLDRVA